MSGGYDWFVEHAMRRAYARASLAESTRIERSAAHASALTTPNEICCVWKDLYMPSRRRVVLWYLVRSVSPSRARRSSARMRAVAGGEKPPPSGSWRRRSTTLRLVTRARQYGEWMECSPGFPRGTSALRPCVSVAFHINRALSLYDKQTILSG